MIEYKEKVTDRPSFKRGASGSGRSRNWLLTKSPITCFLWCRESVRLAYTGLQKHPVAENKKIAAASREHHRH